jgi:type IV secretory pathway TrbF-like protein
MTAATADHNPYLAARHVHNERYLSLAKSIRNWQLLAGGLVLANLGLSGGLVSVTNRQQITPYIVEVDAAGVAVAIRELRAESVQEPLVLMAVLKRWITDMRTVSSDEDLTRRQMNAAYRMCLTAAQNYLTAYYTEHPIASLQQRGRTVPVNITVTPLSPQSWRARWKEETRGEDGTLRLEEEWEATFELVLILPKGKEEQQFSPLGIWISTLQWAEV